MRIAHALAALAVAASLSAGAAPSNVPTKMSYQGFLTSGGAPVNTTVSMTVKIYDDPTAGSLIWSESQSVAVANGVYNVVLGNTTPIDQTVLAGPRYLTVAVAADPDMLPRTPLASAPYAILARAVEGTIPVTNGGTGTSFHTPGGLLYGNGTNGILSNSVTLTDSAGSVTISHPGAGTLTIQSAGTGVSVQGVGLSAGSINLGAGNVLSVGGNQVVGARGVAVANALNATGVDVASAGPTMVVTVAEFNALVALLNSTLDRLRDHGLIAP